MESTAITAAILCCSISGIVILSVRLALRKVYFYCLDLGDYLASLAIFTLAIYVPAVYLSTVWGTANIAPVLQAPGGIIFTLEEIRRRTVGSKCVLVARAMYVSSYVYALPLLALSWSKLCSVLQ